MTGDHSSTWTGDRVRRFLPFFIIIPLNQPTTVDESAEAAARKELAYPEQFGQPLLPFRRERRDSYQYQEQSPSAHI